MTGSGFHVVVAGLMMPRVMKAGRYVKKFSSSVL